MQDVIKEIEKLKQARKAVILAHLYQPAEIQDIADFTGDSLELSRKAAATDAEVIVFCGVHFMAETANILSPEKIVLLPSPEAGCRMADMAEAEALRRKKAEKPGAAVVSYVNTSAAVKALSDICCTSANVLQVVESIEPGREIIFVPDCNLGGYAAQKTGRKMELWEGFCPVHKGLTAEEIDSKKAKHPDALVLAHPECTAAVLAKADYVGSTTGIIRFAIESEKKEFIIATERGVLHQLEKVCPDKVFYLASESLNCRDMKYTTLEDVRNALASLEPRVVVPEQIREKAVSSLMKMLDTCS